MADHPSDPNLDRLLRHMAWANAAVIAKLTTLPDSALRLAAPKNEWNVGRILDHLVSAAGGYATRLEGGARMAKAAPTASAAELISIKTPVAYAPPCSSTSARKMIVIATAMPVMSKTSGRVARAQSGAMP